MRAHFLHRFRMSHTPHASGVIRIPLSMYVLMCAVVLSTVLAGCATDMGTDGEMNDANASQASSLEQTTGQNTSTADDSVYADGEYETTGTYVSPAGEEEIDVMLTLENGVIVDAGFMGKAENNASVRLQGQFAEGYKEVVVGRSLDELSLTVVNGSSLTPKGFMDAVEKIKLQAAAEA